MKVCKHCGTDSVIIDKLGRIYSVCKECQGKILSKSMTGKNLGEKNHFFGKKHNEYTRKKISDSQKGKSPSADTRKKLSESTKGKPKSESTKLRMSKTQTYSVEEYYERYPWLSLFEKMKNVPFELGKPSVEVQCRKCNDWFRPPLNKINKRIVSLQNNKDNNYFYCSDECKHSCPLFRLNPISYINSLNYPDDKSIDDTPDYQIFRKEVLTRQLTSEDICYNHCEMCNIETNLEVHHEKPQKTHPHLALDPDNGIILCHECHRKYGHSGDCSTGALANMICT